MYDYQGKYLVSTKKVTKSGKSKCHAAAREGMKPSPTLDVCCNFFDNPLITNVLHTSAVGAGFIPALPTADKIKSKYPAAARVGINPTPTVVECCNHFDNPLIARALHTSAVETGFIPVLPTADKIKSKCTAAAREGMKPSPTLGKCYQCMNMYAKQTSRMIPPSGSGACAGKGFMPFLK